MFAGFKIELDGCVPRFVTPAILDAAIADMVRALQATDPQDKFTIKVEWMELPYRPDYQA